MNEQLILLATLLGSIAALPVLIEFLVERRKRKERLALSLDDVAVSMLRSEAAGLESMLDGIADLIDRARNFRDYTSVVHAGNEILIIGGNLWGKKALARVIAQRASIDRLITVYNPRNTDALAKARSLITRYNDQKVMLLLAGLDAAFGRDDEDIKAELDALIEETSAAPNVLVIGTALRLEPNSPLDNAFGVKLLLPGTPQTIPIRTAASGPLAQESQQLLTSVARYYLGEAAASGFILEGFPADSFLARLLEVVSNPAEIQDILALCQTAAIYRHKRRSAPALAITPEILDTAIRRVVTGTVVGQGAMATAG